MDQIITNEKKIVFHITYNPVELKEVDSILSALTIAHLDTIVSFQGPGISWSFPLRAIKSMQIEVFPESSPLPSVKFLKDYVYNDPKLLMRQIVAEEKKTPDQRRMPKTSFPDPASFEIRVPKPVVESILKTQIDNDPFGLDVPEDKQMKLFDESTPSIPIYNLDV